MTDLQLCCVSKCAVNELSPSRDVQIHKLNRSTEASTVRLDPLKDSRGSSTSNEATNSLISLYTRINIQRGKGNEHRLHRSHELVKIANKNPRDSENSQQIFDSSTLSIQTLSVYSFQRLFLSKLLHLQILEKSSRSHDNIVSTTFRKKHGDSSLDEKKIPQKKVTSGLHHPGSFVRWTWMMARLNEALG